MEGNLSAMKGNVSALRCDLCSLGVNPCTLMGDPCALRGSLRNMKVEIVTRASKLCQYNRVGWGLILAP